MSDQHDKLIWQIGHHSSSGIKTWRPEHRSAISYAIQTLQSSNMISPPTTLAIVAEPWLTRNPSEAKAVSQLVVDTIIETFANAQLTTVPEQLALSFALADQRIHADIDTLIPIICIAAAIVGWRLYVASCGSCRVFLVRDGIVRQVSVAHTFPESLIETGHITPDEFLGHEYSRPGPIRALGFGGELAKCDLRLRFETKDPDVLLTANQGLSLRVNDTILVCSGLMFWDFLIREDWRTLTEQFGQVNKDLQTLIDDYVATIRPQRERITKDITVLALRPAVSKSVEPST